MDLRSAGTAVADCDARCFDHDIAMAVNDKTRITQTDTESQAAAEHANLTRLVHELQVHQVELETQNDHLRVLQQELEASHRRYQDLFDHAPVAYLCLSLTGQITEANLAAASIFGIARQHLLRQRFADDFVAPADQAGWQGHFSTGVMPGASGNLELHLVRADGSAFPARVQSQGIADIDGSPAMRIAIIDMLARVEAENQLRRSEERLALALDATSDGHWDWNLCTGHVFRSARWSETTGYSPREIAPSLEGFLGIVHFDDRPLVLRTIEAHRQGASSAIDVEFRLAQHGGDTKWLRVRGRAVERNFRGAPLRIVGTITDITAQKASEQAQRDSDAMFRSLFEHSLDGVLLGTSAGDILAANPAAERMFGYDAEELRAIGRPGLVDASDPHLAPALAQSEATGAFSGSLVFIHKDGRKIPVDLTSTQFSGEDGRMLTAIFVRDISERKRIESQVAAMSAEMRQLLEWQVARHTVAALAHELNQPLAGISALAEAARRMSASGDRAREWLPPLRDALGRLAAESERAGSVVWRLMESLRGPAAPAEPVAIASLLADIDSLARSSGLGLGRIIVECPDNLPTATINRLQIEKVLLNLIGNGIAAMKGAGMGDGRVWLSASAAAEGCAVCITVRDEGPGVPAGMERQIFHPFVGTRPEGLGMGLTISRALVEAHGGKLWYSGSPTGGASFHFTLPADETCG